MVPVHTLGYLTIWPTGEGQPTVSTLNSPDGRIKANAAIVPAGVPSGSVSVYVTDTTNVVLDIDGYFAASSGSACSSIPLTPCRVADTRNEQTATGGPSLAGGMERDFPVLESACGVPSAPRPTRLTSPWYPRRRPGLSDGVARWTDRSRWFPR